MRAAADASRTAADKAERLGRLNSLAAQHLTRYVNVVVPGSAPSLEAIDSPTLSGGDLLADSQRREVARANVGGFLKRQVRKADELQEQTTNATQAVQHSIKILRNPNGPRGAQSSGTGTPTRPHPPCRHGRRLMPRRLPETSLWSDCWPALQHIGSQR